jgi:two-component system phosphate regulon sensor histidine kinase PhoR
LKINLHYKITFLFALIIALILLGIFLYLHSTLKHNAYNNIKDNLYKELALSKDFLKETRFSDLSIENMKQVADLIAKDLKTRVTIIAIDGKVLGDSELSHKEIEEIDNHLYRLEVQDAFKKGRGESRRYSETLDKDMLYVATTFSNQGKAGVIRLALPLSEVQLISLYLNRLLMVSIIVAFGLAIVIAFFSSLIISKPIKEVAWVSSSIAAGDYTKRILITSHDELGDLARAFNHMSEQIRTRIDEVVAGKARLEAVLLSMFEGVMVLDADGKIRLMNERLKEYLKVEDNPIGKKTLEIIRNIEIQEIVDKSLKIKKGLESREISVLVPDERILSIHATPIINKGNTEGSVLVFYDITDLRRLEKIRQDFVANVSHELRTPIASIKGYAETLLDGAIDDKENAKDFIEIIHSDSERLASLINDILDLSKIESGQLKLTMQPISLTPIIKKVVKLLSKQAKAKGVKIEYKISKTSCKVMADKERIAQVILNLLDNAIKYNKLNGKVTISCREDKKFLKIDIADTGLGIPAKDLDRVFERFYRADKARSRELGSTGLGLSIVKHIIEAHGGAVSVESTPDDGSVFSFSLPKA